MPYDIEKIRHDYKSKHTVKSENQVILLMITDCVKWYYLALKVPALLRKITSKHGGNFYYLNCFHSYSTKDKLKKLEDVCEKHGYCYAEIPKEDNKILKYDHGEKSMKVPFFIYRDLEPLLEKLSTYHNNPEKSSSTKINKHKASGYSLFIKC